MSNVVVQKSTMPKGWGEVKLKDVAKIQTGKRNSQDAVSKGDYPLFDRSQIIKNSTQYIIDGEAVIVAGEGTEFTPRFYKGKFDLHQRCYAICDFKDSVNGKYIYYYLNCKKKYFAVIAVGSTVPSLRLNHFENFPIFLPPLPEQKSIAEVLSSLDDKINLLHRQNKTLETMAQTLFRKWFIEDAKSNWEEVELRQFINWSIGYSYRSIDLMPSNIALVTLKNFARDGSFRMDGFKEYVGKFNENQIVHEGDLVVAHTDLTQSADVVGNPTLVYKPAQYDKLVMTMDLMKIESNQKWLSKEFLYYLMKTISFKGHCLAMTNGSTVLHLSRDAVPSFKFLLPDKNLIEKFSNTSRDLVNKQFHNRVQIFALEKVRNLLLPKLMSGKARVNGFVGK